MYISRPINIYQRPKAGILAKLYRSNFIAMRVLRMFINHNRLGWLPEPIVTERTVEIPFVLSHLLHFPPGSRFLEVGVVGSEFPVMLTPFNYEVDGIDIREYPLVVDGFRFFKEDATKMKNVLDDQYDACYAISVLEHIGLDVYESKTMSAYDDEQAVREMMKKIKPGGVILITVPFGVANEYPTYRVYDRKSLNRLTSGLIKDSDISYYKKISRQSPSWHKVNEDIAEQSQYSEPLAGGPVECVACLKLMKQ